MAFNVNNFRNALPKGGARPSLIKVVIPLPPSIGGGSMERISLNTQAASIPSGTIEPVEVFYFGRPFKLPGGRTFEDWTTTVINDEDFAVRRMIEVWQENILGNSSNVRGIGKLTPSSYMGTGTVTQFGKSGGAIREYKIANIWPSAIAEITLDWSSDTIQEYTIEFAYEHWTHGHDKAGGGDKAGSAVNVIPAETAAINAT